MAQRAANILTHARQTTAAATASASARMRAKESLRVAIARLLRSTMAQRAAKLQLHTWKCCPVEVCAQDLVLISTTVKICQVASAWTQQWWATASAKAAITSRRAKPIACKLPPVEPSALTQPDAVLYMSQRHARKARMRPNHNIQLTKKLVNLKCKCKSLQP